MDILTYTTLYPNVVQPHHGIFVEQRLRHLIASGLVNAQVIAPVPWFPFKSECFGKYARFATVPQDELRHGVSVLHPRYPLIPKTSMTLAPYSLAASSVTGAGRLIREGYDFRLIDAHYFYPDGVAAAMLGKLFQKPVVITARGTDINLISKYTLPRFMICWAARQAAGIVTVCQALKNKLVKLGIEAAKITVLRNGVDLQLFSPIDRDQVRHRLGITKATLLSVGNLIPIKGHDLAIRALVDLPATHLFIVGQGEAEGVLKSLASSLGLSDRVRFVGSLSHEELRQYYAAADILILASSREGWANVLLESMACGTPVIATNVGGSPEIINAPEAGVLVEERSTPALSHAIKKLLRHYPDRGATRRYAEQFSWEDTTGGQLQLFTSILANQAS